jgi:hypothetical protein
MRNNIRRYLVWLWTYSRSLQCQWSQREFLADMNLVNSELIGSCKLTLTDGRNRLKTDIVEAVECLRDWLREGTIQNIVRRQEEFMNVDIE